MRIISKSQSGSALLIVLAFVVLIAGLVLVFFSRSILEEQVSSSSANQVT
jgi:Tfp pilus assembly protein PilX